ncbi:MAB_1171c family putative transporter [Nocardia sp. NPDC051832]|uniref:MAB_1171c family putative transporter n=1 Tax=Nocardia sp. NPDC051832 TaxID=3155673 RepID=UPI003415B481
MNSPAPLWLAMASLGFASVVTVARWLLVDVTITDRLVNRVLSWQVTATLVVVCGAGTALAELSFRVFLALGIVTLANLYGLAVLFNGADPYTVWQRQRIYDCVGALAAITVLLVGRPDDVAAPGFGWKSPLVWILFNVPMAAAAFHVGWASIRELRIPNASVRERILYSVLSIAVSYWMFAVLVSGVSVFQGEPSNNPAREWTTLTCSAFVVITMLLALPLWDVLLGRIGLDRPGRHYRKLHPLWRDLATAVPEVVLVDVAAGDRGAQVRLYRMMVEIRDALRHLHSYIPADQPIENSVRGYARQMSHAARAKAQGSLPATSSGAVERDLSAAHDLAAELDYLIALARAWPRSQA